MQVSFWWWQYSDRYIISLFPHIHTPSLKSLMVCVDVKHHVYLLTQRPASTLVVVVCSQPCYLSLTKLSSEKEYINSTEHIETKSFDFKFFTFYFYFLYLLDKTCFVRALVAYKSVWTHTHTHWHTYARIHTHSLTDTHIRTSTHTHTLAVTHSLTQSHTLTLLHTVTHTHTVSHTHTCRSHRMIYIYIHRKW